MTTAHTDAATVDDDALAAIEEEIEILKQTYEENPTLRALVLARRAINTLLKKTRPSEVSS